MKKIFNILMLAAVVALTSCNYEPEGWHGTIFEGKPSEVVFDQSSINFAFAPDEGTVIEIPVSRGIATEAYTTNIQLLDGEGKPAINNPDYALMVLEQAKFEVDQYESVATLTFDRRQFTAGKKVGFYLQMEPTQIDEDVTLCALTILRDYTWSEYCTCTMTSYFYVWYTGVDSYYTTSDVVVLKTEGSPMYKILDPYSDGNILFEFSLFDGTLGFLAEPDNYGDVEYYSGLDFDAGYPIVRYFNVAPESTIYDAESNTLYSTTLFYVPGLGSLGSMTESWSFDKPL